MQSWEGEIQAVNRKMKLVSRGKEQAEKKDSTERNAYMSGSRKENEMLNFSVHSYFIYNVTTQFNVMKMQREICAIHLKGEILTNKST